MSTADTTSSDSPEKRPQPPEGGGAAQGSGCAETAAAKRRDAWVGWSCWLASWRPAARAVGTGGSSNCTRCPRASRRPTAASKRSRCRSRRSTRAGLPKFSPGRRHGRCGGRSSPAWTPSNSRRSCAAAKAEVQEGRAREGAGGGAHCSARERADVRATGARARRATLVDKGWSTGEKLDQRRNEMKTAEAAYDAAVASLDAAKAKIVAGQAEVARLKSQIDDFDAHCPEPWPHPIQARAAGGGIGRRRPGSHAPRPERRLHDDLRAGRRRRSPCDRR